MRGQVRANAAAEFLVVPHLLAMQQCDHHQHSDRPAIQQGQQTTDRYHLRVQCQPRSRAGTDQKNMQRKAPKDEINIF